MPDPEYHRAMSRHTAEKSSVPATDSHGSSIASARVHPTAIVDTSVQMGPGVEIGPGCIVRGDVKLGAGVKLIAQVCIEGPCEIGEQTSLYPFACIGFPPQDYKFKDGAPTAGVKIGRECLIREHVTIHQSSKTTHPTTVGDRCMLMVASHLGHDTVIGNDVILVNAVLLAGHVRVGDKATLSGNVAVHQFCRVGRLAFVSGGNAFSTDVPPFCIGGSRNTIMGLNKVGMRRNGVPREDINQLDRAFRLAFAERIPRPEMISRLAELAEQSEYVREFRDFLAEKTGKSIAQARFSGDGEVPLE